MAVNRRAIITSLIGTCVGVGYIIKDRLGGRKYTYQTDAAKNKVIVITGATTGLGKATAKELAYRRATVVLACRDMQKCCYVRDWMKFFYKSKRIECMECDLASQESIRNFAQEFNNKYKKLDVLINNAGVMEITRKITDENIELHLGVNHMGHFLLTSLLLPKLQASAPSRIINITTTDYRKVKFNKEDPNYINEYNAREAYKRSKLANILFTRELSERLQGSKVTVNAVYPGVVNTDLMRNTSFYRSYFSSLFLKPILWTMTKNPKQGSQPVVYAAIEPSIAENSGYLIGHNFVQESLFTDDVNQINDAKWLWKLSEKWTHASWDFTNST